MKSTKKSVKSRKRTSRKSSAKPIDLVAELKKMGAIESVKFDEDTGRPYRAFTIKL